MHTLLIDNHDSFTYNLYQLLSVVNGAAPTVVRNDEAWRALPLDTFDNIVISPGPGHPACERDFGISACAIREAALPILGVCLGHQGICLTLGGVVHHAPEPVHGRRSRIFHTGRDIFEGVPSPFAAVRYHSLIAAQLPDCIEAIAWTDDGLCMALRHVAKPIWGVQFHPESVHTEHGRSLIENFRRLTEVHARTRHRRGFAAGRPVPPNGAAPVVAVATRDYPRRRFAVMTRRLDGPFNAESTFVSLFAAAPVSFWLDSSAVIPGTSRFSFMGDAGGPHAEQVFYQVGRRRVTVERRGERSIRVETIFEYLDRELHARYIEPDRLDVPFVGGYVGCVGYEVKADCDGDEVHRAATPDAMFVFADRFLVFDHREQCVYAIALYDSGTRESAASWVDLMSKKLAAVAPVTPIPVRSGPAPSLRLRHSSEAYLALIAQCLEEIRNGESYEVCLTNAISANVDVDPLTAYRLLRKRSPAPYAAYLRFGAWSVLSASPERFLLIDGERKVESKPIKGTQRRGVTPDEDEALRAALSTSEKDRAENLMIVDLLRNDLGSCCVAGSIHVSKLFDVETYATVHQLVSTVQGRLRDDVTGVECVRAAFPGGSMTGAPKKRTMEILDRLEEGPRGIYSGALGYFSLRGEVDLSIVIRTMIVTPGLLTFGIGGAVVALSDPEEELAETWLKARALLDAIGSAAAVESLPAGHVHHESYHDQSLASVGRDALPPEAGLSQEPHDR